MTTRGRVYPDLLAGLHSWPTLELSDDLLPQMRGLHQPPENTGGDDLAVEYRTIPGPAGEPDVRLVIFRSIGTAAVLPALLYIHGGGFVSGSPEASTVRPAELARRAGCVVVSASYRLAPEAKWPAAVEDIRGAVLDGPKRRHGRHR
jgi:acetyl esterase/lipase